MIAELPILSIITSLPLFSSIFIMIFVKHSRNPLKALYAKYVALLSAILTFISSLYLLAKFDINNSDYQFVEIYPWLKSFGLDIHLGIDGISIYFVVLTTMLTLICILLSLYSINKSIKEFLFCLLMLEGLTIGVFCSLNLLLFYIFFEAILVPMYLIIGIWGGAEKIYASIKFFIYTLVGSILFLLAIVFLFQEFGTLSIPALQKLVPTLSLGAQKYLWMITFIAFAVKVPMWPLHTWLPDAHVQAPTAGSVILAGLLLKVGAYGMLRVSLPMLPEASLYYANFVIIFSVIAILYGSFVAISQTNMKKMIAYSSIAHMGYVTAGIFSFSIIGLSGAVTQMISHGIVSSALFIIVGMLSDRLHHIKEIESYGGVAVKMPILATLFMIFVFSSIGLPGTSGFVGEFYSLYSIYSVNPLYSIFSTMGVVFGAVYMFKLYHGVMLGGITNEEIETFKDLSAREILCLAPLAILTIIIGIYPSVITSFYDIGLKQISETIQMSSKL